MRGALKEDEDEEERISVRKKKESQPISLPLED
jgi:hypothetical protein